MSKVWRVAKNEYLNLVRSKAFLVSVFLMPVFSGGAIAVQTLLGDRVDLRDRRVAVVDGTFRLLEGLERAAKERDAAEGGEKPRFVLEDATGDEAALAQRVRAGDLFAYVLIQPDIIEGAPGAEVTYHTQNPTYDDLPRWIGNTINGEVRRIRFEEAGIDGAVVDRLSKAVPFKQYGVAEVTATGEVRKEKLNELQTFLTPMAAMFLLFMLVMMAAPILLNTVLEEKIQRIAEILVSSVSPFELFLGKLMGTVLVSWTLFLVYVGGGLFVAAHYGALSLVPFGLLGWFLFFQLLALLIFGSIFSAIGAACNEMRDAQSMMTPAMLIVMMPMFVWFVVLKSPDSPFAVAVSLFPPATPFLMLLRLAIPPGPAAWEVALACVLTAAFTLFCVWAAGKIFRIGILAQGQPPSFRRLAQWVFSR
ncbi:MAG TPA: ABC transporter permease [Planctomycetota bacterium]|nr:ABC transporter permease [Planctomycetota bacterium]